MGGSALWVEALLSRTGVASTMSPFASVVWSAPGVAVWWLSAGEYSTAELWPDMASSSMGLNAPTSLSWGTVLSQQLRKQRGSVAGSGLSLNSVASSR
jgi:hypothetical protein